VTADSPAAFFAQPSNPRQRRYEVLRAFFLEGLTAEAVARRFGYAVGSVYAITRDFRRLDDPAAFFFRPPDAPGRPPSQPPDELRQRVIELRKANLSAPDIKARLDAQSGHAPSLRMIGNILTEEGFARLPRRTRAERAASATPRLRAPESVLLDPQTSEEFQSERAAGLLCLLP
jgi:transposase